MGKREPRQDVYAQVIAETMRGDGSGPSVVDLMEEQVAEETEKERKTKRRPSEVNRPNRRVTISLPTVEWKETVLDQADRWGVRTSDFLTFCIAYTMAAIESGELRRAPRSGPTRFYHRAGEALELPWSPGDWTEEKE